MVSLERPRIEDPENAPKSAIEVEVGQREQVIGKAVEKSVSAIESAEATDKTVPATLRERFNNFFETPKGKVVERTGVVAGIGLVGFCFGY